MIDYYGNRAEERFTFREVDLKTWAEGRELGNITGGSSDVSIASDLKATCTFYYYGEDEIDPNKGIRIYHSFTDDHGESAEDCIGTYIIGFSDSKRIANYEFDGERMVCTGTLVSGKVTGWSVLKIAQGNGPALAYTIEAGANVIAEVRKILGSLGIQVVPETNGYTLKTALAFPREKYNWLTICNELCAMAGYLAPYPDAWGVVQLTAAETSDTPIATFANDDKSIMQPEVVVSDDWQSTPNICRICYSTDDIGIQAEARNETGARWSLDMRPPKDIWESVSELQGQTPDQMLANLKAMAAKKLRDNSREIEHVSVRHAYIPIKNYDCVAVSYAGSEWLGNVYSIHTDFKPSAPCETDVRSYIAAEFEVAITGSIVYEVGQ